MNYKYVKVRDSGIWAIVFCLILITMGIWAMSDSVQRIANKIAPYPTSSIISSQ